MTNWLNKLKKSDYLRHVGTLMAGTGGAQILGFASTLLLTRIYGPEHFAVLGVFLSVVIILGIVSCGGYELALMLPKEEKDAQQLLKVCLSICALLNLGLAIFIYIDEYFWSEWIDLEILGVYLYLLPIGLWMQGWGQALRFWMNRKKQYAVLSSGKMILSLATATVSILMGYWGYLFEGLVMGFVAGKIAQTCFLFWKSRIKWEEGNQTPWELAKQYSSFFKYGVSSGWLNTLARQLPFLILPLYYAEEVVGYLSLTQKVLLAPISLISMSIGQVFYQRASDAHKENHQKFKDIVFSTFKILLGLGLLISAILVSFAPILFEIVFGSEWRESGVYAQILSIWLLATFIAMPISFIVDIKQKLEMQLLYSIVLCLGSWSVLWWGGQYWSEKTTLMVYGITGSLIISAYIFYLLFIARTKDCE